MTGSKPVSVLCIYRIEQANEKGFLELLAKHWPTLDEAGLVSPVPAKIYKASDKSGNLSLIEMFEWKDENASGVAHQTPEIMRIWEPMGALAKDMEFLHIEPVQI